MILARKANRKAKMDSEEGKPGTVVWAKLAGFALWPARLAKLSEVSPTVSKAKRGTRQQLVYFFGSYDYAWVSQVQPWDENYERNIKGSKAKAFAKGLKEARQWLTARKHVFPVYQVTSGDDEDSSESESESASGGGSSSDEEQLTSKRGSTKTEFKRRTAKGKQAISNRKGRDGESGRGKLAKKDEASEGDAESRRNAKRRRLEQRQTERQARDSDPEAMKRRVKRHAIQRRLGLCPPAGVREIVLLQRERKTREEEKDAAAATEKEKRAKQKVKEERKEEEKKKKKKEKKERGKDDKRKDRTGKRDTKKRKRDKDLGDKKERPTKVSRKKESTEEGKHGQASDDVP